MKEIKGGTIKLGGPGSGPNEGDTRGNYNTKGSSKKDRPSRQRQMTPKETEAVKREIEIIKTQIANPLNGMFVTEALYKDLDKLEKKLLDSEKIKRKSDFEKAVSEMQKGDIATGAKLDYIKYGD